MLCCAEFGLSMEVYVKGRLGVGFLDLYDLSTHQYYEVKSSRAAKRFHTQTQMVKYDNSLIQDKRFEKVEAICDSSPRRGTQMITGSFAYGIYDVTFSKTQDGLIEYSVELNSQRTLAEALVLVGLLCYATGNVPGGAVANAYAVALF